MREELKDLARAFVFGRPQRVVLQAHPSVNNAWTEVFPAQPRIMPGYRIFGDGFAFPIDPIIPAIGLFCFEHGRSTAYRGWTFNREGLLVAETTWFGTKKLGDIQLPNSYLRSLRLEGTCLSLLSEYGIRNYGHFILDCISRVGIALRAGWSLADIDYFYVYEPPSKSARRLMDKLGIDEAKCVYANRVRSVLADKMLVTSFPGTGENYAPIVPQTLSRPWGIWQSKGRRLFIPRRGTRRLTNAKAIEAISREFGLEIYEPSEGEDDFRSFAEADLIVAPHGAGLANLAFCRAGTKVFELTPSDHILPYFCTLSAAADLKFNAMLGRSTSHRSQGATGPSPYDFWIDPSVYRKTLETLLAFD